jgi:hypothetical protein
MLAILLVLDTQYITRKNVCLAMREHEVQSLIVLCLA